ncbi:MAG TPA: DUF2948 family protein [Paracoccaceae bacterium]|nr:DUF2948 family protein [Paracoccaceae bacterium]
MTDARFADGDEAPVALVARDADDLAVISALVQDAVLPATEMTFRRRKHQFALLLNRFRWEDREAAARAGRRFERVRSILLIDEVVAVRTQGIDRQDADTILSVLSVTWEPGEDGTGRVILTLAGDGAVALEVEALEVTLRDVTRPYLAPSGKAPAHGD